VRDQLAQALQPASAREIFGTPRWMSLKRRLPQHQLA
jgi:hypothetical protein